jgi:hypothetical protein
MSPDSIYEIVFHGMLFFWLGVIPILLAMYLTRRLIYD